MKTKRNRTHGTQRPSETSFSDGLIILFSAFKPNVGTINFVKTKRNRTHGTQRPSETFSSDGLILFPAFKPSVGTISFVKTKRNRTHDTHSRRRYDWLCQNKA